MDLQGKLLTGELMSTKCRHNVNIITLNHADASFVTCQVHIITSLLMMFSTVFIIQSVTVAFMFLIRAQSSSDTHTQSHNTMWLIVHLPHCCHTVSPSPSRPANFPAAAALPQRC